MRKVLLLLLLPFSLVSQEITDTNSGSANALALINSLSDVQKKIALFSFDEMNRYDWHYVPPTMVSRIGFCVKDMDNIQKQHLDRMLQNFLSKEGYTRTKTIMDFEKLLKEMQPENINRIPENYFVSIYGSPGKDSLWGWKFTGHHLTLNFTVLKDKIAFAPFFFGIYPSEVKEGPKKGLRVLKEEEDLGFELVNSLSNSQKQKAIFQLKAFTDIVTTNSAQVAPLKPVGILAMEMTISQKAILNKLLVAYLLSMPPAIAQTRMKKITAEDMNSIRFGWAGGTKPGIAHYFRVQGKTFLIEFDNTQNNASHIHTVWRDFNGDFGQDLMKEHYSNSKHHQHK